VVVEWEADAPDEDLPMSTALRALIATIERRLRPRGIGRPPDGVLFGAQRAVLTARLQQGLVEHVAVLHWPTFYRVAARLCAAGVDGLCAAVAVSLPVAVASGVTADVIGALERTPQAPPLWPAEVTRCTGGRVIFRAQLLRVGADAFAMAPPEMASLLEHHTPAAIRAILHSRLIGGRPDLTAAERQRLVADCTRHLGHLLSESACVQHTRLLLRLAYYRHHHAPVARPILRRLRIVDFHAPRAVGAGGEARPLG
jgi:hypothetical protein